MAKRSLTDKAVSSGAWSFGIKAISRGLSIIKLFVIARLLSPEDLGLFGIAMLVLMISETMSQTGFFFALIQKKKNIQPYLNSAWSISVLRGVVLFAIIFSAAPLIAGFFGAPEATLLVQVVAFSTLVQGFKNIGTVYFQKELEFRKQFIYETAATVVDFVVTLVLTFLYLSVWGLIVGFLAGQMVRLVLSYVMHSYRPKLNWDKTKIMELFGFGKWVMGTSGASFLVTQIDDIIVGRFLGVATLGLYQMAYRIANLFSKEIAEVMVQVLFPTFSKIQDDIKKIGHHAFQIFQIIGVFVLFISATLFVVGHDLVALILGDQWLPMVPAMLVLAIFSSTRALTATMSPIFLSTGKPKVETSMYIAQLVTLAILLYPFSQQWGLMGVAFAVAAANIIHFLMSVYKSKRILQCSASRYVRYLSPGALAFISSTVIGYFLMQSVADLSIVARIGLGILITTLSYSLVVYITDTCFDKSIQHYGKKALKILSGKIRGGTNI